MATRTINKTMKGAAYSRYGSPDETISITTLGTPKPSEGEVLVAVEAAGISIGDRLMVEGLPLIARPSYGFMRPKHRVVGQELAGRVVATGTDVRRFEVGDRVLGFATGAFAEFAVAREDELVLTPAGLSAVEAAAVPVSALAAYQALHDRGGVTSGDRVLILGASGAVGTYTIQIAKAAGAEVTAVNSTRNIELARSLGADHVIDYTADQIPERSYDVIIDLVGKSRLSHVRRWLTKKGTLVLVGGSGGRVLMGFGRTLRAMMLSPLVGQRLRPLFSKPVRTDLEAVADLLAAELVTPVIDRTYPLAQIDEAMAHIGSRHTQGKTVVTV